MNKFFSHLAIALAATMLFLAAGSLTAVEKTKAGQGYDVKLSATHVWLMFPDGSEISAPLNFDGKSLDQLSATGGMARELLDTAYEQMGMKKSASLPKSFSLAQNTPNPFNPSTTISYDIPEGRTLLVELRVYNLRGQLVRTLVNGEKEAGTYHVFWDGRGDSGRPVSSGVYFYRIKAGEFTMTRKMVLLK